MRARTNRRTRARSVRHHQTGGGMMILVGLLVLLFLADLYLTP